MSRSGLKAVTHRAGCGYGDAACAYLVSLDALDIAVSWQPQVGNLEHPASRAEVLSDVHDDFQSTMAKLWQRPIAYDTLLFSLPPSDLFERCLHSETVGAKYCFVTWELQQLPLDWPELFNHFDGVIVPSHFNARVFESGGVDVPVTVIPHLARKPVIGAPVPDWLALLEGLYVFYTIGTWTTRKAMEETIRAYLDTFTASDDVCLVVKTEDVNQMSAPLGKNSGKSTAYRMTWYALARILASYPSPARVHLVTEHLPPAGIDSLHSRGDCYLSLTHSEGWGLGAFDALQFGNPVIMPGFGGQLDYLGDDYPLLVRYDMEKVSASPSDGYFRGMEKQLWARACRRHASELLQQVYADRSQAAELGRYMQANIADQFSSHRVGPDLARVLGLA